MRPQFCDGITLYAPGTVRLELAACDPSHSFNLKGTCMSSPTKIVRFQPGAGSAAKDRTFEIHIMSEANGYTAQVVELLNGGSRVNVCLPGVTRCELPPGSFFSMREHYRGEFVSDIRAELRYGTIVRCDGDTNSTTVCYLGANMRGWPDGYPTATADNMATWIND